MSLPSKPCEWCKLPFAKRVKDSHAQWEARQFCSNSCRGHVAAIKNGLTVKTRGVCNLPDCNKPHRAHGLCDNHYHQKYLPENYQIWHGIKQRCMNPTNKDYHKYGARGISLHKSWVDDFKAFDEYVGKRPSKSHSIDRKDNDGNYEPGNVRWATKTEQAMNRRDNHLVAYKGVTQPLMAHCREVGVSFRLVRQRLDRGWSIEKALNPFIEERYRNGSKI